VIKGFTQVEWKDYNEISSLVVKHYSIRILMSIFNLYSLVLKQLDVETTFLREKLERPFTCNNLRVLLKRKKGFVSWKNHCVAWNRIWGRKGSQGVVIIVASIYLKEKKSLCVFAFICKWYPYSQPIKRWIKGAQNLSSEFKMKDLV